MRRRRRAHGRGGEGAAVEAHVGQHPGAIGRALGACGVVAETQHVRRHLARHEALQPAVDVEGRPATTAHGAQRVPPMGTRVQVERGELVIIRTLRITRTQLRAAPRHVRGRRGLVPVVDAER